VPLVSVYRFGATPFGLRPHTQGSNGSEFSAAAGLKSGQSNRKKLDEMQFYFSDRINQSSSCSKQDFALAGRMDRI